jgi:Kef-type K+ transport system membrane component KefB
MVLMGGHSSPQGSVDILRKSALIVVLVAAMLGMHQVALPPEGFEARGLLALGFIILAAYTIGELAEVIKLPHITGYLLAGLALGPSVAHILEGLIPGLPAPLDEGVLNQDVIDQLVLLDGLALALIALTAGGELQLKELRQGLLQITGVLAGQAVTITVGIIGFLVAAMSLMPDMLPALAAVDTMAIVALGAVVASISFATSPAATIAVINSTGAKGPLARTTLSAVVLKDVLVVIAFSASTAVATGMLGLATDGGFLLSLWHIAQSILLGIALGGGLHLYMRYVDAELLLFLVGMIYTTTFVAEQVHAEAALVFIVAGIVVGNFSGERGHKLIHEVERLSGPVYVVFFTLAGAKLHLDELWAMLPLALGLVVVRVIALVIGVRAGAVATNAAPSVKTYGWMGFVSQAGLAITLATAVKGTYPDGVGEALFSVLLGGVALNEMLGPVLLQMGLGFAGEVQTGEEDELPRDPTQEAVLDDAPADLDFDHPFGPPLATGVEPLDRAVRDLQTDLQELVRDRTWGPLDDQRRDAHDVLKQLKRDYLRLHRRLMVQVEGEASDRDLATSLRQQVGDLGDRWRDHLLAMSSQVARSRRWSPLELVEAVDAHVASVEPLVKAPVLEASLVPREEGAWMRARRSWLRTRVRMGAEREVNLRDLARFHLSGATPERLEGLAALMIDEGFHLAQRIHGLFEVVAEQWERVARQATSGADRDAIREALERCQQHVDEGFDLLMEQVEQVPVEGTRRAAAIVGAGVRRLKDDVVTIGTLDLPHRKRRYSRVFAQRNRGLARLGQGLLEAQQVLAARYSQLALELELDGLEGRLQDAVEVHGDQLERMVRGRGARQLELVEEALSEWLDRTGKAMQEAESAPPLARALRSETEPLVRRLTEARQAVESLHDELSNEGWLTPFLEQLHRQAQGLTERYVVPSRPPSLGAWALPTPVPTSEVAFQDLITQAIDSKVTRQLLDLTTELAEAVQGMSHAIDEVERVVSFNLDLAVGELDVVDRDAPLSSETRELVGAMASGAVRRSHQRLQKLVATASELQSPRARVQEAVIGRFERLHQQLLDGQLGSLRLEVLRDAALAGGLAQRARELQQRAEVAGRRSQRLLTRWVGPERIAVARDLLGLPGQLDTLPLRDALQAPDTVAAVPIVYRRLFADQALEGSDLLSGRLTELERVRIVLRDPERRLRSAAVVSLDAYAAQALVNTALRSFPGQVVRLAPERPMSVGDVESWLEGLPTQDACVVVEELRWLYRSRPGGLPPLERLLRAIVADSARRVWIVHVDPASWRFLRTVTPLGQAMGDAIELQPLGPEHLEEAVYARHRMSGYDASFGDEDDLPLLARFWRSANRDQRRKHDWFAALHEASAGVVQDALRLWMAAIDEVDEDDACIHLGDVPRPPVARLAELPDDTLVVLVQTLRQGWIDAELHAWQFRTEEHASEAALAQLAHLGLLEADGPRFRIAPHLRGPLARALRVRGWA